MNKKKTIVLRTILGIMLLLAFVRIKGVDVKISDVGNSYGSLNGYFLYFHGSQNKTVKFDKGSKVTLNYAIDMEKGTLQVKLKNEAGKEILIRPGETTFIVNKTQKYTINVKATHAWGKYKLAWSNTQEKAETK